MEDKERLGQALYLDQKTMDVSPVQGELIQLGIPEEYAKSPVIQQTYTQLFAHLGQGAWPGNIKIFLYSMLVTRPEYQKGERYDLLPQHLEYTRFLQGVSTRVQLSGTMDFDDGKRRMMGNPGWYSIVTCPENGGKIDALSRKRYATIDVKNISAIQNIDKLALKLREVALATGDSIQVKVPDCYESFVQHPDSFVIHYKKDESVQGIETALQEYLKENHVQESQRNLGRTKWAADAKDTSFSEKVAGHIATWVSENYGQYKNSVLASQAILHAIQLSQSAPKLD